MTLQSEENVACSSASVKDKETSLTQKMWSIGGGKGGTGKSFVTLSLGVHLARMPKKVVIIDADLGGANVHTLLGIRSPEHTLNDFLERRVDSLNQVSIETPIDNLKITKKTQSVRRHSGWSPLHGTRIQPVEGSRPRSSPLGPGHPWQRSSSEG